MRMSIEDIKNEIRSDLTAKKMTGDDYSESLRNSIAQLLVIAEKYQKIEQILHNGFGKGVYSVFDEIVKVVEDGNNN